jgi:hypothetical protein
MKGRDHRFVLTIPVEYLPHYFRPKSATPLEAARVPFVAKLADFSPAGSGSALLPGTISGTVSWGPEGMVRQYVDGSWLNSLSQYDQPLGSRFGLEVRTVSEAEYFPAELYVRLEPNVQVFIECKYTPPGRAKWCQLWTQSKGGPVLIISLEKQHLPQWQRISDGSRALVMRWLSSRKGGRNG